MFEIEYQFGIWNGKEILRPASDNDSGNTVSGGTVNDRLKNTVQNIYQFLKTNSRLVINCITSERSLQCNDMD